MKCEVSKIKILSVLFIFVFIIIICFVMNNSYAYSDIPDIETLNNSDLNLPSKYDLRNVDGVNYTTPVKNQANYGLCWAFSATTSFESTLKKSGYVSNDFNEWYSPYQLDALLTPHVKEPNINYVTISQRGGKKLGEGAPVNLGYNGFTTAYSPVLESTFDKEKYRLHFDNITNNKFKANDIYNEKNSDYYVTDYDILESVNDISLNNVVKYYVYNYGAVSIDTIDPSKFCNDFDSECYINSTESTEGRHAMAIIGWDDSVNSWILQNSWADYLSYIYLSYGSDIREYVGIKRINKKHWDNRYYSTNNLSNEVKISVHEYEKIPDNDEIIDSVLVDINAPGEYSLYISRTGNDDDYELIKEFNTFFRGRKTIDLLNDNISLSGDKFKIKVTYNGDIIVDGECLIPSVEDLYVFTKDSINTNQKKLYIYDMYDITSVLQNLIVKFKSINIDDKSNIEFKITDNNNKDITEYFNLKETYFANNYGQLEYDISDTFQLPTEYTEYTISAFIEGQLVFSKKIGVSNMYDNFEIGTGTNDDPFIITRSSQLKAIAAIPHYLKYSYKLGCDIDLLYERFIPIGNEDTPFTGTFDGDNYSIYNLRRFDTSTNYSYHGLFGYVEGSMIKNLKFKDSEVNTEGLSKKIGILVGFSKDSTIHDIRVEGGTLKINGTTNAGYGSIVGYVDNTNLYNLYSSMDIIYSPVVDGFFNSSGGIGGLVGISSASGNYFKNYIKESEFSGNFIIDTSSIDEEYTNDYMFNDYGIGYIGEIIGIGSTSFKFSNLLISGKISLNCHFSEEKCDIIKSKIGYLAGKTGGLDFSDSIYYLNGFDTRIVANYDYDIDKYSNVYAITDYDVDGNDRYINKNSDKFLKEETYDLNFSNIWFMNYNKPVLRNLTINLIDKNDVIGETTIYDVDCDNLSISNVKTNEGKLTKKEFVEDFITFSGEIYFNDGINILSDEDLIKTGMIVKKNLKEYIISVNGDVDGDGRINVADVILFRRYLVGYIELEDYQQKAADINHDGKVNGLDLTILRRGIAGGYDNICQYLWRNC